MYRENTKKCPKKPLEFVIDFNKIVGHTVDIQNQLYVYILAMKNWQMTFKISMAIQRT